MRHFLAGIPNCAAPLVAALSAIFLIPSGLSDFAAINSSGRESPHLPGDSIPAQRNDIFSPGAESNRAPSIASDVLVDRASMSFGAEAVEVAPSSPGSIVAASDSEQPKGATSEPPNSQECVPIELSTNSNLGQFSPTCGGTPSTLAEIAEARAYLLETASPGYTMMLQGPEVAISRLHPEFAVRLESAIREARDAGLPFAGIFSAYRPPVFGVGGFSDKFHSLHTYGLAVDMRGIGRPGSPEAQLWHQIAAKNGVVCPYGPRDRAEWNHCQPTSIKIILADNPLRQTVNSEGPFDLETMFEVGSSIIEEVASTAEALSKAPSTPVHALETTATAREPMPQVMAGRGTLRRAMVRLALRRSADKPARYPKEGAGIGVGGPILAVEEGQRKSSVRQAKHGARVVGLSKITLLDSERTTPFSAKKRKHDTRVSVRSAPVIAVEESRPKSKRDADIRSPSSKHASRAARA
jgi:hypothetical protein